MADSRLGSDILKFLRPQASPADGAENAVLREQQRHLSSITPILTGVMIFSATAVILVMLGHAPIVSIIVWYIAAVFAAMMLARSSMRHAGTKMPDQVGGRYLRRAEYSALVIGVLWGFVIYLVPPDQMLVGLLVTLVQTGNASGLAALAAPLPRISMRYLLPSVLLTASWYIIQASGPTLPVGILTIIFVLAILFGGLNSRRQLVQLVRSIDEAQTARRDLSDAIEALHDAFAVYDAQGTISMCNSRFREWFPGRFNLNDQDDGNTHRITTGQWVMGSVVRTSHGRQVSIHTDVTALKTRERELIAARREAEEANAAKGRFLSTMSHELRTPLDIINGFSRLMKGRFAGSGCRLRRLPIMPARSIRCRRTPADGHQ